jgi:hypothetical protein
MSEAISSPPLEGHIAPCGLFCTACGKLRRGKCRGCQVEAGFSRCPVRKCCVERKISTCAECADFKTPRDYRECRKVHNPISRVIGFFTGSSRPAALALLRDQGREAYLASKRDGGKM